MKGKMILLVVFCTLLLNNNFTLGQSLDRVDSSRVFLLAIFKNTGENEKSQENYFSCILLDPNSSIGKLLPYTDEYYHYFSLLDSQNIKIEQEISKFFLANVAIGAGVSHVMACMEILEKLSANHSLYDFVRDTVLQSQITQIKDFSSDILNGKIINEFESGDLYFIYDSTNGYKPIQPPEFKYSTPGYYYWLTLLNMDYILIEDDAMEVLAASYTLLLNSRYSAKKKNIIFTIGNTISAHLNNYSSGEYIPVALPYKVSIAE